MDKSQENQWRVIIMALKSKKGQEEELPFDVEIVNEPEQVNFDDLEFEAEYVDEEELQSPSFTTISGKPSSYEPTWEQIKLHDLDVGDEFEGRPEITIFENKDKTYNALRLNVLDDGEILSCYLNFPKKDWPYVKGINKYFDFYRTCFDFIFSVLKLRDERNVVDKDGEEVNRFKTVNLETFAKYVDTMERVGVRVTEGNPDSDYNSWEIYKME
jgi:hypothetical protein